MLPTTKETTNECKVEENFAEINQFFENSSANKSSTADFNRQFVFASNTPSIKIDQTTKSTANEFVESEFKIIQINNSNVVNNSVNEEKILDLNLNEKILDDLLIEVNHNELNESNLNIYNSNNNNNNNKSIIHNNNNIEQINTIIEELFDMTKDINNINDNANLINHPNSISLSRQQSSLLNSAISDYELGMLDFPLFETIFTKQIDPMISTNALIK